MFRAFKVFLTLFTACYGLAWAEDLGNSKITNTARQESLRHLLASAGTWSPTIEGAEQYRRKQFERLQLILHQGADPNLPDQYGITPMMIASRAADPLVVKILTNAGGKPFDETDLRVKAALIRIDAELLSRALEWCYLEVGATFCQTGDSAEKIER